MINGYEADRLVRAQAYGTEGSAEREDYQRVYRETEEKFRDYLKKTYGNKFSLEADAQVYSQAWRQGHEYGYGSIENEYESLASFAIRLLNL